MSKVCRFLLLASTNVLLISSPIIPSSILAQTSLAQTISWQPYDESNNLALLADHKDELMRFKLLNSKFLNKNTLWMTFENELADFSESEYQSLKPLIMDKAVRDVQLAVRQGKLSYESLTLFYIYRIRQIETDQQRFLNAVISLNPDAIERARTLDRIREAGRQIDVDSVFGMPVLLKDNIAFAGLATTAGALALKDNHTANAFVTQRLEDNGAIIFGKANLSEWAYFFCDRCPSGYSAMGGQTLNPYGRFQFGSGGSSSGSAVAVVANLAMLAVGSETSGSILSPASSNSLVGLKPTTGSLSRSGVVPISATLDTVGPITRTVEDAVILFNAMTAYDQADMAMPLLAVDYSLQYSMKDLSSSRLGVISDFEGDGLYQQAISILTQNGATAIEVNFSSPELEGFLDLLGAEMVNGLALYLAQHAADDVQFSSIDELQKFNRQDMEHRAPYGQALVDMMLELNLPAVKLQELREHLQSSAKNYLDQIFSDKELTVLLSINNSNAAIAALANYPALTVPMGYEEDGRPVGLTLIAPPFQEQDLIDVGAQFERLSNMRIMPEQYQ